MQEHLNSVDQFWLPLIFYPESAREARGEARGASRPAHAQRRGVGQAMAARQGPALPASRDLGGRQEHNACGVRCVRVCVCKCACVCGVCVCA